MCVNSHSLTPTHGVSIAVDMLQADISGSDCQSCTPSVPLLHAEGGPSFTDLHVAGHERAIEEEPCHCPHLVTSCTGLQCRASHHNRWASGHIQLCHLAIITQPLLLQQHASNAQRRVQSLNNHCIYTTAFITTPHRALNTHSAEN
jgi:hypothetical protein